MAAALGPVSRATFAWSTAFIINRMGKLPRALSSVTSILLRRRRQSRALNSSLIKPATGAARLRLRCIRCADSLAGNAEQRTGDSVRGDASTAWNPFDAISSDGERCPPDTHSMGANETPWPGVVAATVGAWTGLHLAFRGWAVAGLKP